MQDEDVVREFLIESYENLSRLDRELVELEQRPKDAALLASIFRCIHTIKGTCGFLAFSTLESITHQAENLLSQLRDGQRDLNPLLVSLILETVDASRRILASIEANGEEGPEKFEKLTERLRLASQLTCASPDTGVECPPPDVKKADDEATKPSAVADANIRVGVGLLDKLMDLVGELVLTRNQILQFNTEREDAALNATAQRLNLITTELQEGVMKTRMQPIGIVWNNLPRVVRDMAVALGKEFRIDVEGAETELDRTIIEAIKDPLVHLVRNSCDHGIELPDVRVKAGKPPYGTLFLRAYHEGGQVNIEIGDDGRGIDIARVKQKAVEKGLIRQDQADKLSDREALNLVFAPGFSMAQAVTNVSGRGVGMDVVKSNIEKIGGVVDLVSHPGEGATVKLKIPLTLAIIPGLVITSGGERFVIPQMSLLELIRLERESLDKHIEQIHGTPVYRRRGSLLPIAYLNQILGLQASDENEAVSVVVLQAEDRQFGLVVDGINDTQEIVVKPLGKQLKGIPVYAGATIMGDGRVALILDVLGIGQNSGVLADSREPARATAAETVQAGAEKQRLLLFRAGSFERVAVPLSLVARLEEFPLHSIERAGGSRVVQYRGRILPLIPLRDVLEPDAHACEATADPVQVIVVKDGERSVGIIVDHIVDVVEEAITIRQKSVHKGLLGSAVIGKKVTDVVDLNQVINQAAGAWTQGASGLANDKIILLAESSAFSRGLLRSGLDMAGYAVLEAASLEDAIHLLEKYPVDVVIASLDLPHDGSPALLDAIRHRPEWEGIPVLALADTPEQATANLRQGFRDCLTRFDREAMLASVARLATAIESAELAPAAGAK